MCNLRATLSLIALEEGLEGTMAKEELEGTMAKEEHEEEPWLFPTVARAAVAEEQDPVEIAKEPLVCVKEESDDTIVNPYIVKALTCVKVKASPPMVEPEASPQASTTKEAPTAAAPTTQEAPVEIIPKKARPWGPPNGQSKWRAPPPPIPGMPFKAFIPFTPPLPRAPYRPEKPPTLPCKRPAGDGANASDGDDEANASDGDVWGGVWADARGMPREP